MKIIVNHPCNVSGEKLNAVIEQALSYREPNRIIDALVQSGLDVVDPYGFSQDREGEVTLKDPWVEVRPNVFDVDVDAGKPKPGGARLLLPTRITAPFEPIYNSDFTNGPCDPCTHGIVESLPADSDNAASIRACVHHPSPQLSASGGLGYIATGTFIKPIVVRSNPEDFWVRGMIECHMGWQLDTSIRSGVSESYFQADAQMNLHPAGSIGVLASAATLFWKSNPNRYAPQSTPSMTGAGRGCDYHCQTFDFNFQLRVPPGKYSLHLRVGLAANARNAQASIAGIARIL